MSNSLEQQIKMENVDFELICRICMNKGQLKSIHVQNKRYNLTFNDMLSYCASIQVKITLLLSNDASNNTFRSTETISCHRTYAANVPYLSARSTNSKETPSKPKTNSKLYCPKKKTTATFASMTKKIRTPKGKKTNATTRP